MSGTDRCAAAAAASERRCRELMRCAEGGDSFGGLVDFLLVARV